MTFAEIRAAFDAKMTAIADKMRIYTKKTDVLGLDDMVAEIDAVAAALPNQYIAGSATTVVIPYGCETIRGYAFIYSKNIKSVIVESKAIRLVGYEVFQGCESLEEFRIKEKGDINYFSQRAFYKCPKLKVIDLSEYSDSKIPTLAHVNAFEGVHSECVIKVPSRLYDQWIVTTNWVELADRIVAV